MARAKIVISIVAIVAIGLLMILKESRKREISDISFAFVEDLAAYTSANEEKLPKNWNEFVAWSSIHTSRRWKEDELEARFAVPWGMNVFQVRQRPIITVVNPQLKYLENGINSSFDRRFQLKDKNDSSEMRQP